MPTRDEVLADDAAHLLALIVDEIIESPYDSAASLIEARWKKDRAACEKMLREAAIGWTHYSESMDAAIVEAATRIEDPEFLDVVNHCAQMPGMPGDSEFRLLTLLIDKGYAGAREQFVAAFRRCVHEWQGHGMSDERVFLVYNPVWEICRLQLEELLPELTTLKRLCEAPVAEQEVSLEFVDAAITMFRDGPERLREAAVSPEIPLSLRAQSVFCLACGKRESDVPFFRELYWKERELAVRLPAIDAMAYLAPSPVLSAFLVDALGERLIARNFKAWWAWSQDALVPELLLAAYHGDCASPSLIECVTRLLDARNKRTASDAYVVLERLHHAPKAPPNRLERELETSRYLMRFPVMLSLKVYECANRIGIVSDRN